MWYLIVPPIIVIVSLSFVLWYLSQRGSDPAVANKVSQLERVAVERVSFSRTKNFFLRILEKTAYRFKVVSLQAHNSLSDVTRSLKEKRKPFLEKIAHSAVKEKEVSHNLPSDPETPAFPRGERLSRWGATFRKPLDTTVPSKRFEVDEEAATRPMVSEEMVLPEVPYQKTSADIRREEGLIARIAVNPKDFMAYEELGDHYLAIGNVNDAKECYRQVLKLSPVQRMAKIKIRRLERMLTQKG